MLENTRHIMYTLNNVLIYFLWLLNYWKRDSVRGVREMTKIWHHEKKLNIIVLVKANRNYIWYGKIRQACEMYTVYHIVHCLRQKTGWRRRFMSNTLTEHHFLSSVTLDTLMMQTNTNFILKHCHFKKFQPRSPPWCWLRVYFLATASDSFFNLFFNSRGNFS